MATSTGTVERPEWKLPLPSRASGSIGGVDRTASDAAGRPFGVVPRVSVFVSQTHGSRRIRPRFDAPACHRIRARNHQVSAHLSSDLPSRHSRAIPDRWQHRLAGGTQRHPWQSRFARRARFARNVVICKGGLPPERVVRFDEVQRGISQGMFWRAELERMVFSRREVRSERSVRW